MAEDETTEARGSHAINIPPEKTNEDKPPPQQNNNNKNNNNNQGPTDLVKAFFEKAQLNSSICLVAILTCVAYLWLYIAIGPACLSSVILAISFLMAFSMAAYVIYKVCEKEKWFNISSMFSSESPLYGQSPSSKKASFSEDTEEERQRLRQDENR